MQTQTNPDNRTPASRLNPDLDDTDRGLIDGYQHARWEQEGPLVGDWVILKGDGSLEDRLRRFTHSWGDYIQTPEGRSYVIDHIQTTDGPGDRGSFVIGKSGRCSFSGSLDPGIPTEGLLNSGDTRLGRCWFFSHGYSEAGNGVGVRIPFTVWVQT